MERIEKYRQYRILICDTKCLLFEEEFYGDDDKTQLTPVLNEHKESIIKNFDLTTVLGDFIETIIVASETELDPINGYPLQAYSYDVINAEHPFFLNYDVTANSLPRYLQRIRVLNWENTPHAIKHFVNDPQCMTMESYEYIKSLYDVDFKHKLHFRAKGAPNVHSGFVDWLCRYSYFESDEDKPFADFEEAHKIHEYICRHISDVAFAILHRLIIDGYKFAKCKHCGGYFAAKKLKTEYCQRFSFLAGYEDKTCLDAKKAALDKLQKKKIAVEKWLAYHSRKLDIFNATIGKYENLAKDVPTVENIQNYHNFLFVECENIHKRYERARR